MTDFRWFALWMILVSLAMLAIVLIVFATLDSLDDVQHQLDHIDAHFQAPEPTPRSQEVTG